MPNVFSKVKAVEIESIKRTLYSFKDYKCLRTKANIFYYIGLHKSRR